MKSATSIWSRLGDLAGLVATPLVPSHYVELVRPLAATHTRRARVEAVRRETADSRTLVLRPGRGFARHRAGQHVRVTVEIDGRLATRTYSITSPPERRDGRIEITVKAQPGGRVSRALVHGIAPGAYVSLGLPDGDFVLPEGALPPALLVTAGSGITPVMAMLRSLAARGALPDIAHVHFARTAADVIFGAELYALAAAHPRYRLVVVHTAVDPRRMDRARLDELVADWRERQTWACGPTRLVDAVTACFAEAGRKGALHVERFAAVLAAPPADATGGVVRFGASATRTRSDGRTPLLQIAESAGVLARHGCRMGICHSCDTTLLAGRVRDLRTGEEISEPGTRVQICVCAAAGDVDLDL